MSYLLHLLLSIFITGIQGRKVWSTKTRGRLNMWWAWQAQGWTSEAKRTWEAKNSSWCVFSFFSSLLFLLVYSPWIHTETEDRGNGWMMGIHIFLSLLTGVLFFHDFSSLLKNMFLQHSMILSENPPPATIFNRFGFGSVRISPRSPQSVASSRSRALGQMVNET